MARPRTGGGRVTKSDPTGSSTAAGGRPGDLSGAGSPQLEPLYKRKPGTFIFMIVACAAMVLSMMAGIFTSL